LCKSSAVVRLSTVWLPLLGSTQEGALKNDGTFQDWKSEYKRRCLSICDSNGSCKASQSI